MNEQQTIDELIDDRLPRGFGGRFYGVYTAVVTDIKDEDGQGRVKIKLPWVPDTGGSSYEAWARLATMMAGNNQGSWFVPDVNVEVLVLFEGGDPRRPFVIGSLWNGVDSPPESIDKDGNNYIKMIRSKKGIKITLDDKDGQETLTLETPGGQKITLKDGAGSIVATDSNGNSIKMESGGITVQASSTVTISASNVKISAGMVTVDAGMSKFSGVVKADTVIANSVVSSSYTPGAGNIW